MRTAKSGTFEIYCYAGVCVCARAPAHDKRCSELTRAEPVSRVQNVVSALSKVEQVYRMS